MQVNRLQQKANTFIGIMHTNRLDLLRPILDVIKNDLYYLIDNSDNRDLKGSCVIPTQPLSYAQGMNFFRQKAIELHTDYIITMHEDIKLTPEILQMFKEYVAKVNLTNNKWGLILTNEDSLCAYNTKLLKELKWDTRLPDYFGDTDYQYWAMIKGFEIVQSDVPVYHYRSQTIQSDEKKMIINDYTYPLYAFYYRQKCGGDRGKETYTIPFNNILFK